jgi:quinoprotein glucose dehydrogenase
MKSRFNIFIVLIFITAISCKKEPVSYNNWFNYGGSKEMTRYSSLNMIDTSNVKNLKVLWSYSSGITDSTNHSQIQCNPIIIDGILYGVNPSMSLFAIDAASGKEKWVFNAATDTEFDGDRNMFHIMINSRGIAYWSDGKNDKRIFFTAGSNTFAINAETGKPITTFGKNGSIDLHEDLDRTDTKDLFVVNTSPGIIYKNLLILGTRVDEQPPAAPGHIRAFDVITGKRKWIFHTIPHPGEMGFETWEDKKAYEHIGGGNVWSGFSLDENRGILFAGTGSAAYDFYGGTRKGSNLFANCVLALDANSGKRIWHYQITHHDLWDKDLPTPPALIKVKRDGKEIDAVAQTTKNGMLFIFERETGKPIFEIKEIPVETKSELLNEKVWPTQPIPTLPIPFARQVLTLNDINPYISNQEQAKLKKEMSTYRHGNMFLPPGKTPSLVFPGYDGGAEWGGPSFDPETGLLYINSNEMAWIMQMLDNKPSIPKNEVYIEAGQRLYKQHCASCHGNDRKGTGNNPNITNIANRYNKDAFIHLVNSGRRMMPGFKRLSTEEKNALATFILDLKDKHKKPFIQNAPAFDVAKYLPYKLKGYDKFLTEEGYPAISPPWGTLNAINVNTGEYAWKIPFGEYPELKAKGIPTTGCENYGGSVVTAGGLLFIAATKDGMFRAFNKLSGKLLWEYKLPAPGFATPAIYELNGKQFIVIACGGGKLGTVSGDKYLAFGL